MNHRRGIILSFGLNLLLAGVIVWGAKSRGGGVRPAVAEPITNRVVRIRHVTNDAASAVVVVAAPFHWAQVESTDYRTYIANLRAIGCPEATIHDIVAADVNELFAERVRQIVETVTGQFWNFMVNRKEMELLVKNKVEELDLLGDQRQQMMRDLFEEDGPQSKVARENQRAADLRVLAEQLNFLPEEKIQKIQDASDRRAAAWDEFLHQNGSASQQDQPKKNHELLVRQDREIQALLTPEEYEEYKLRTTGAATNVRSELSDLEVSPEEVRGIARAKMNSRGDDAIRQLLGPERFADYQRATDHAYQQTLRITDRFDLPAETAAQVYQMQKAAEAQARAVRDDRSRTVEERQAVLLAMRAETGQSLSAALGPKVFKAYQKYNGDWLNRFADGLK